ncbi:hypothetical protein [Paraclostridium sordellii]|uniref:hypothetical protein n=1 Tax=Paraclostridium sordellii TaxID=1505 RepID=UPI0022E6BCE9|nr:hypothetical protein [Paeniclostridium sordellii]
MKINMEKMNCKLSCFEEIEPLEYFKQFNIYQNININNKSSYITNIEKTIPKIEINSTKIINSKISDSIKGTSLEGQHLSGKNLIIIGTIGIKLILEYEIKGKKGKVSSKIDINNIKIPFSTFIAIPEETYENEVLNLRYLIEDTTISKITENQLLISITMIIQYID